MDFEKLYKKADKLYNESNFREAAKLFLELATKGDTSAMDRIGSMYADGEGVEKDFSKAVEWYKKSVVSGGLTSLYNLGMLYKDNNKLDEAKRYFERALKSGDQEAAVEIAKIYMDENQKDKALSYLQIAMNEEDIIPIVKEEAIALYNELIENRVKRVKG